MSFDINSATEKPSFPEQKKESKAKRDPLKKSDQAERVRRASSVHLNPPPSFKEIYPLRLKDHIPKSSSQPSSGRYSPTEGMKGNTSSLPALPPSSEITKPDKPPVSRGFSLDNMRKRLLSRSLSHEKVKEELQKVKAELQTERVESQGKIEESIQKINDFLSEKCCVSNTSYPVLIENNLIWKHDKKKPPRDEKKIHRQALKFILRTINQAHREECGQFTPLNGFHTNLLKDVHDLRRSLIDNRISKHTLFKKSSKLTELWRRSYLSSVTPYAEIGILTRLKQEIDTILKVFVEYQCKQIEFILKGALKNRRENKFPHLSTPEKNALLQHVYVIGLDETTLEELFFANPSQVFAMSPTIKKFSLIEFFNNAISNCEEYMAAIKPLEEPPVFEKYIKGCRGNDKKELEKYLENRNYDLIIASVLGDKQKKCKDVREKLQFALIQLGLKGKWLIEELKLLPPNSEESKKIGKIFLEEGLFSGYKKLEGIIQLIAQVINTHAQEPPAKST